MATRSDSGGDSQCEKRNYKEAIQCLVECDAIICAQTERLASKDKQIADLERKIVEMSFELASLKAFADEHRSNRRSSSFLSVSDTDTTTTASVSHHSDAVDICVDDNATSSLQVTSSRRNSLPAAGVQVQQREGRKWSSSLFSSLGSMNWEEEKSCCSDDTHSPLDESKSSTKISANTPQFFRKTKKVTSSRRNSLPAAGAQAYHQEGRKWSSSSMNRETSDDNISPLDESESSLGKFSANISQFFRKTKEDMPIEQTVRRPPHKKKVERQAAQQTSAASSIVGVVFPSSFESVVYKGCL
jgi:hypothetical protein